jgi:hypothetical protein
MDAFLIIAFLLVGLYWFLRWLRSDQLWSWLFGLDDVHVLPNSRKGLEPYLPPVPVRARHNFGVHYNPTGALGADGLGIEACTSDFEQHDERTWQCPKCLLVRYERPEAK